MMLGSRRIQGKSGFSIESTTPANRLGVTNLKEHQLNGLLDYHRYWFRHQITGCYEVGVIEDADASVLVGATISASSPGILGGTPGTSESSAD
jgi:hypothetical protein